MYIFFYIYFTLRMYVSIEGPTMFKTIFDKFIIIRLLYITDDTKLDRIA